MVEDAGRGMEETGRKREGGGRLLELKGWGETGVGVLFTTLPRFLLEDECRV